MGVATTENSREGPENTEMELPHDPAIPLLGMHLENMKTNAKRCMHSNVYSSTVYKSQDKETTQGSNNRLLV